jgi:NAD(P)-dependent dehydrogenase (short-subunit alcohol dehydrogenase family)/phosphopantetheinyl transferase (holo-ACP synthase)
MGALKGRIVRVLGEGGLADAVRSRLKDKGAVLEGDPDAVIDLSETVYRSFALAQSLEGARPRDWVCATQLGLAPSDAAAAAAAGGRAGFAKAIGREWDQTVARVVDVGSTPSDENAAAVICQELAAPDGTIEIFWDGADRSAIELQVLDLPDKGEVLGENLVVVLTGGTRGITAQVAKAFAARGPCKLALLARTPPGETPLDEAAAKAEAKAAIEADGKRATPAKVRDRVAPLKRAEEARENLAAMVAAGAEVAFFQVDMADPDGVRAALDAVRERFGPIDGIVHGAGVEESRLIADKDERAFHRVFDGKAIGGLALAVALEPDAWFVSMGSVAGRFGNPGQVDYSAANEAMARVCIARPRSLHVGWTAWGDVGMAVRGGMESLLTNRGVELLPAKAGASLLVDMVAAGITGEIIVSGRLGDFGIEPGHGLLDELDMDGDAIITRRVLSLESDPWIADHAIDGKPVLPGVIGLELMAATAALAVPGRTYAGATDVAFKAPVKLHRSEPTTLIIRAEPSGPDSVRCTLSSERTARTGRLIGVEHFTGTIHWVSPETESLPPMALADHVVDAEAIYRRFFHGPGFQVLTRSTAVAADALMAEGQVQHASICGGLLTQPLVLEAAFQAAGLHGMMTDGLMALPEYIGQVAHLGKAREGESLTLTVRKEGERYDVDVDGAVGPVLRLRGFKMVKAGPLPPDHRFEEPVNGWQQAVVARASAARDGAGAKNMLTESELAQIAARGTAQRQVERQLGRVAAKRAIHALTGEQAADIEILNAPSGKPVVRLLEGGKSPQVSISHRDGYAVAVATPSGHPGIDLEVVEPRPPSFSETWFRSAERALTGGEPRLESQVWAIKEAVLKSLGMGMALSPLDIEVVQLGPRAASVVLWGEARARHGALGGEPLRISLQDHGSMVVAVAWMAS